MTRAQRLQDRFDTIQQTVDELYGKDLATCAAAAAYLRAIQYGADQSMISLGRFVTDGVAKVAYSEQREKLDQEHQFMLMGYHKWLCKRLGVDEADSLKHSLAFEEVIRDICLQGE